MVRLLVQQQLFVRHKLHVLGGLSFLRVERPEPGPGQQLPTQPASGVLQLLGFRVYLRFVAGAHLYDLVLQDPRSLLGQVGLSGDLRVDLLARLFVGFDLVRSRHLSGSNLEHGMLGIVLLHFIIF